MEKPGFITRRKTGMFTGTEELQNVSYTNGDEYEKEHKKCTEVAGTHYDA